MTYFNILRNRHNKFLGFNVDGFSVKSWEQLQALAEKRIAKNDPSWEEIQVDGCDLQTDSDSLLQDLLSEKERQKERIATLEQQSNALLDTTIRQNGVIADIRAKAKAKITEMKAEVKQEIKAVELILKAIQDGQSSHWQKKENIRLALEILATIPTFDRGDFLNYEDDF